MNHKYKMTDGGKLELGSHTFILDGLSVAIIQNSSCTPANIAEITNISIDRINRRVDALWLMFSNAGMPDVQFAEMAGKILF